MSRKAPPAPKPKSQSLPSEGGSWIRQADGQLLREGETPPETPAAQEV